MMKKIHKSGRTTQRAHFPSYGPVYRQSHRHAFRVDEKDHMEERKEAISQKRGKKEEDERKRITEKKKESNAFSNFTSGWLSVSFSFSFFFFLFSSFFSSH